MNSKDEKGFIFTLDAALAVIVTLVVLAGVATLGDPYTSYKQHGHLQLERYANDGLHVLAMKGTTGKALQLLEKGDVQGCKRVLRENLRATLPDNIHFRLKIENRLTVYSSDYWKDRFDEVKERVGATYIGATSPWANFRLLAWIDDDYENEFLSQISESNWIVYSTSEESDFENQISRREEDGDYYYDAIFIPDADIDFGDLTGWKLEDFSETENRRLIAGGDTIYNNPDLDGLFGVYYRGRERNDDDYWNEDYDMVLWNTEDYILEPYVRGHLIPYPESSWQERWYYHDYDPDDGISYLGTGPESDLIEWDLPGIIPDRSGAGTRILFNVDFAKSAIVAGEGSEDWKTVAKRSIYGKPFVVLLPIQLHVWRGGSSNA